MFFASSNILEQLILTVHPVPGPSSIIVLNTANNKLGINNQKAILLILGKAVSLVPIINGTK